MKFFPIAALVTAVVAGAVVLYAKRPVVMEREVVAVIETPSPSPTFTEVASATPSPTAKSTVKPVPTSSPSPKPSTQASLVVPFTTQAPTTNWDALHEEACEEAGLLMLVAAKKGQGLGSVEEVDQAIKDLVAYETEHGLPVDLTLEQIKQLAKEYFGLEARIERSVSAIKLQAELLAGHPVLVTADGKKLENSHFKNGGPVYHALVVKGFAGENFTVNDPGTKFGDSYTYAASTLINAMHDWDPQTLSASKAAGYLVLE